MFSVLNWETHGHMKRILKLVNAGHGMVALGVNYMDVVREVGHVFRLGFLINAVTHLFSFMVTRCILVKHWICCDT